MAVTTDFEHYRLRRELVPAPVVQFSDEQQIRFAEAQSPVGHALRDFAAWIIELNGLMTVEDLERDMIAAAAQPKGEPVFDADRMQEVRAMLGLSQSVTPRSDMF